jgi:hypothetical protein
VARLPEGEAGAVDAAVRGGDVCERPELGLEAGPVAAGAAEPVPDDEFMTVAEEAGVVPASFAGPEQPETAHRTASKPAPASGIPP